MGLEEVLETYEKTIEAGDIKHLQKTIEEKNILPSENIVQHGFTQYFQAGKITKIRELRNVSGFDPSEEVREQGFLKYISNHWWKAIPVMEDAAGKIPHTERIIAKVQDTYRETSTRDITEFRKIGRVTKIEASEEVVQEKYETCIRNNWLTEFKKYHSTTKIKPKLSEELVQERHEVSLGNLQSIDELIEITNTTPNSNAAQAGFAAAIEHDDFEFFSYVQKHAKAKPKKHLVEKGFTKYLLELNKNKIARFKEITNEEITQEIVDAATPTLISEYGMRGISEIANITKIHPGLEAREAGIKQVNQEYKALIQQADTNNLSRQVRQRGIEVREEYVGNSVQEAYKALGINPKSRTRFWSLLEATEIMPNENTLHKIYEANKTKNLVQGKQYTMFAQRLMDMTNIQPKQSS